MSFLNIISRESFTVISNPLAAVVGNNGAVVLSILATKQDYYGEAGKMVAIDGEPFFYFKQPELAKASHITERQLKTLIPKLEAQGFLVVKRNQELNRNYYRVETTKVIELFKSTKQDYEKATNNYIKRQLELNRQEEEVRKEADQIAAFYKKQNEEIQALLSDIESEKSAAEAAEAAAAVEAASAQLQEISDMLPLGMNKQPEPEPEQEPPAFVNVQEPARPKANKREEEKQAEAVRYVWREEKFDLVNDYLMNTREWSEIFIAEICISLEKFVDPLLVTIVDIDAGILDYANAPTKVNAPAKYIARCIANQVRDRYINMSLNVGELELRVQNARFIEKVRAVRPNDPAVLAHDAQQEKEKAALQLY